MSTSLIFIIGAVIVLGLIVWVALARSRVEVGGAQPGPSGPPPAQPSRPLGAEQLGQIGYLIQQGKKIEAIKLVRTHTDMGLKEAKDYVEQLVSMGLPAGAELPPPPAPPAARELSAEQLALVQNLLQQGKTIEAIKLVRAHTSMGLKEAKDYVERL
jgi:ribosomal protein L7/L12